MPSVACVTVLEVGPQGVRMLRGRRSTSAGPPLDPGVARAALEWIDDPIGLYGERPVAVADLWRTVMTTTLGDRCDSLVLVHPDDWPDHRIARVVAAADAVAAVVMPTRRSDWSPAEDDEPAAESVHRPARRWAALPIGVAGVVAALAGATCGGPPNPTAEPIAEPAGPADTRTVIEGRIAAQFPRAWRVERVTGGPGSRRLQAGPPDNPGVAVHLTQSHAPGSGLAGAAVVIGRAIAEHPEGVFVDFDAEATVGEQPALAYREIRPGREVHWFVMQVGSTRIGVGCQSPPGRAEQTRPVCLQVAASAQEVGTEPPP
jgi:type VII secretion-associated protein (TIGR03931 family)